MENKAGVVGVIKALFRFPIKSMHGHRLDEAFLTGSGFAGDRRFAFVRADNHSNFPWLTSRQVNSMLRYEPYFTDPANPLESSVRVTTPDRQDFPVDSPELLAGLTAHYPAGAYLTGSQEGLFDDSAVSLISLATINWLGEQAGLELDPCRFRPNLLVETLSGEPFEEEKWVGSVLQLGDREDSPQIRLESQNIRCVMINFDPDTAQETPAVLREVARSRKNKAGLYGSVVRPGWVRAGDAICLLPGHPTG